ncbi:PREDICTED: uncharacterized protein LOC105619703 [Atta cephalotes]|uniref:Uncharacterized protein n=1 Tax=Atta cephalotes TaxID=12957 RepID=A0A158NGF4_ATTCE|nr:PREDICTED: uncharacterized protein LOC105619703 [Atta cephalotes]
MNVHDDISDTFELPLKNQFGMQSCKIDESESRPNIALKRIGLELDKAETKCFTLKSELNYMMDVCRKAQTEIKGNVNLSPKPAQFSPRKSINDDDTIEGFKNLMEGSQKELLNDTITSKTQLDKKLPRLIITQNMEKDASKEYESYYFPSKMSLERMQADDESYIHATPYSAKLDIKDVEGVEDPKLNLNTLNIIKAKRLMKSKSKTGRSEMSASVCKANNVVPKARKRKTKLRSSISKSTVTTRDTGFIGRKEAKKRRHKGMVINCQPLINRSSNAYQPSHQSPSNPPKAKSQITQEQDKSEKPIHSIHNDLGSSVQDERQQCKQAFSRHDDPLFTPNYEMPTLASKLKRSSRSYFSGFNFKNIPFVVGTSVTPSYNLGLNIQQVLSMMKTRQPIANDVTPLLIHKISRGMKPMSILLSQMYGHEGSIPNVSSQMTGMLKFNSRENFDQDKRLSMFNLHVGKTQSGHIPKTFTNAEIIFEKESNVSKQLYKEKVDSSNHKTKQRSSSVVSKSDTPTNLKIQETSRISLKGNIGDHKMNISDMHNSKEIRDVLINLHDQFEEMNKKYERLQSEVDKSNDKSLAKELSTLEKELNVKEEEINAVIGLYKEVMALKQQMKTLHERNSLICIGTESTKRTNKDSFPISFVPEKSQIFGRRKIFNATREPPVSMQLAALLRQIQTFHKQLQLMS